MLLERPVFLERSLIPIFGLARSKTSRIDSPRASELIKFLSSLVWRFNRAFRYIKSYAIMRNNNKIIIFHCQDFREITMITKKEMNKAPPTNNENGFMSYFLRFNIGGFDKSNSYIKEKSSPIFEKSSLSPFFTFDFFI